MELKKFKPTSPARRGMTGFSFEEITKKRPESALTESLKRSSGRSRGRISVRGRGGRAKRRYRIIDFRRNKIGVPAKVAAIEYDPNRTARIALLHYVDGSKSYILAPVGLKVGAKVVSGDSTEQADIKLGNCLPLSAIPVGTQIHNIELRPGKGGQIARGAGAVATLAAKDGKYSQVRLPSSEVRQVLSTCRASIGQIGNLENENMNWGKAGRSRHKGHRPQVRGMAMNPIDHPLGGGEGVGKGHHPVTPWGQPCKGYKTRNNKRTDSHIIRPRKRKGK